MSPCLCAYYGQHKDATHDVCPYGLVELGESGRLRSQHDLEVNVTPPHPLNFRASLICLQTQLLVKLGGCGGVTLTPQPTRFTQIHESIRADIMGFILVLTTV
jgi:hypothetical protein